MVKVNDRKVILAVSIIIILVAAALVVDALKPRLAIKEPVESYVDLLAGLQAAGYSFRFPWDNLTGKIAVVIHDVDYSFEGAAVLADVERDLGVRSVFYLRPNAEYFVNSIGFFQDLEKGGWGIGFHYECLSRADGNQSLAMLLFRGQVAYLRSYFNVTSTSYHGDAEYRTDISNFDLYDHNAEAWRALGLSEVYALTGFSYIRDTDGVLIKPDLLGDLVLVQIHADYW